MINLYSPKAWFPLILRIVRISDFYDIPTSGTLIPDIPDVGDFYDKCEPGCPKNRNSHKNPSIGKS